MDEEDLCFYGAKKCSRAQPNAVVTRHGYKHHLTVCSTMPEDIIQDNIHYGSVTLAGDLADCTKKRCPH